MGAGRARAAVAAHRIQPRAPYGALPLGGVQSFWFLSRNQAAAAVARRTAAPAPEARWRPWTKESRAAASISVAVGVGMVFDASRAAPRDSRAAAGVPGGAVKSR